MQRSMVKSLQHWEGALVFKRYPNQISAYETTKLDSNNALLAAIPSVLTSQFQREQNEPARLATKSKKYDHITGILTSSIGSLFKILLLTYKSLNNLGPSYLSDLLTFYQAPLNLRSPSDPLTLDPPKTRLKKYGDRSFSVITVEKWNEFLQDIRAAESVSLFKSMLKTHFFSKVMEEV